MISLTPFIHAAGILHLLVASVNFFAIRKFRYRDNLTKVSPVVRQVFIVQNVYIVLILAAFAALCFEFAADLAGPEPLGRSLSGFLAGFWSLRILLQLFLYDSELRRQHRLLDVLFLVVYGYLTGVFTLAAGGLGGQATW
jgi:hypothetical protein